MGGAGGERTERGPDDRGVRLRADGLPPRPGRAAPERLEGLRPGAVGARAEPRLPALRHPAGEGGRGDRRGRRAGTVHPAAAGLRPHAGAVVAALATLRDDRYGQSTAPRWCRSELEGDHMVTLLWILAVVLVIAGILAIFRGQMLWGIVLIVVGLLVGPGGVSVFT